MIRRFKPHLAILPPAQRRLWSDLRPALELGFVLYGGTGIALRLAHRSSVDFDFFTDKTLDKKLLATAFSFLGQSTVIQDSPDTLTVLVPHGTAQREYVKVSFFGGIDFGRVGEPELTEDGVLQVASLDDLMAAKIKVILQRIEAKDYIDIASMIHAGVSLARGLASAKRIYGRTFQPSESLKALVYFKGGDLNTLSNEAQTTLINAARGVRDLPHVELLARELSYGAE